MDQEEPSLPGLPGVSWDEQSQTFSNNPRKRRQRSAAAIPHTSSDPAVFSSDDDPALDNYVEGRRKKRYVGSWFQQDPTSSDSTFGESVVVAGPQPKRTLARQLDSGVFLGSDGTDSDDMIDCLAAPVKPKLPQLDREVVPRISQAEQLLRDRIRTCADSGNETIDLYGMGIEELSDESLAPLSQFSCIPEVAKDVAFEQKEPELKLYLGNNSLSRVPGALFDITNLTILSLRGNQLEELPQSIKQLRNLEELNISQNRLRYLPVELLELNAVDCKLKNLIMFPNPFFEPQTPFGGYYKEITMKEKKEGDDEDDTSLVKYACTRNPPRFISRRLGRSQVQETNSRGRIVSTFKLADAPQVLPVDVVFPLAIVHMWWESAKDSQKHDMRRRYTRVPSLVEAALRSCAKSPHLLEVERYAQPELPHLQALLRRALTQREIGGGFTCSECGTSIVVPALEWIEWRDLRYITKARTGRIHKMQMHSEQPSEMALPFLHRACSSRCGPLMERAHWEKPPGSKGYTMSDLEGLAR